MKSRFPRVCVVAAALSAVTAQAQLSFTFNHDEGIDEQALAGFQMAAARWSALISDPITVNLNIGFSELSPGVLGQAGSNSFNISYSQVKTALTNDRTSASDFTAVASLQGGSSYSFLINHPGTPNSTYTGSGDTVSVTVANARALGLVEASGVYTDASITFNSSFNFDFNPANGITAGMYDFVGVATHEIGHALGFGSGVDFLDQHPSIADAQAEQSTLDLFRFSAESAGLHLFDNAADMRTKYFSIDGGVTSLGEFATGVAYGDGSQASHWKDGLAIGIMDPTAAPGELLQITALDLKALDVIGYNLTAVPEPMSAAAALALGAGLAVVVRRRGRRGRVYSNLLSS